MSRVLNIIPVLLFCLNMLSCMKDNDETELSRECYISSVSLGTMKRTLHIQKWSDSLQAYKDSAYLTTFSGSYYRMAIDQLNNTISNPDSLLYETKLGNVLLSITASGTVIYRPENQDEEEWTAYSSTDSVDVSTPLLLRVYSTDGSSMREYRMTLNVHQQDPDGFTWTKMQWTSSAAGCDSIKAVWDEQRDALVTLLCKDAKTSCGHIFTAEEGKILVGDIDQHISAGDAQTLVYGQGRCWATDAFNNLLRNGNGVSSSPLDWEKVETPFPVRLIAAHDTLIYVMRTDSLSMWHAGPGMKWERDECDTPDMMPTSHAMGIAYDMPNGGARVMMMGLHGNDEYATVWGKTVTYGQETMWVHYPWTSENPYPCPALKHASLTRYNGELVAIGGDLSAAYISVDNGITWRPDYTWALPELDTSQPATITADTKGRLWLINGDDVYCGRAHTLK